ncbi:hypothetical protein BH20ACT21_BH20ACT21_12320 [soil metagenome]
MVWLDEPSPGTHVEVDLFLTTRLRADQWPGRRAMTTRLLHRQPLPSGEELVVTARVAETPEDRRAQLEAYKNEFIQARRDVLIAATRDGSDLRGFLFNVPAPDAPRDVPCSFTDVALPRPL